MATEQKCHRNLIRQLEAQPIVALETLKYRKGKTAVHNRVIAALCFAGTAFGSGLEQQKQVCAKVEVLSVKLDTELAHGTETTPRPMIEVKSTTGNHQQQVVVASGPMLGSMDSSDVKTRIVCNEEGLELIATIRRSDQYRGATRQNQLWRPVISVGVALRSSQALFASTWIMELTNGKGVSSARTPPFSEETYPIRVSRELRVSDPEDGDIIRR